MSGLSRNSTGILLEGEGTLKPGVGRASPHSHAFSSLEWSIGMLFPEVVALGIARAPRYGCMGEQSCGGMPQLGVSQLVCLFS